MGGRPELAAVAAFPLGDGFRRGVTDDERRARALSERLRILLNHGCGAILDSAASAARLCAGAAAAEPFCEGSGRDCYDTILYDRSALQYLASKVGPAALRLVRDAFSANARRLLGLGLA